MSKHAAKYTSADKDDAVRGVYRQHGYLVASLTRHGGYGKHREGGNPLPLSWW